MGDGAGSAGMRMLGLTFGSDGAATATDGDGSGAAALSLAAIAVTAVMVVAQESAGMPQASRLAQQNLRPYWHVFAAYALVIVLIGGWAISIARRLRAIEDRLVD